MSRTGLGCDRPDARGLAYPDACKGTAIAAWIKDGGDPRTLHQIRADILLDLLQGVPVPGPDGQDDRPLPGDPDHPGTEDHPSAEIDGWPDDDEDAAGRGEGASATMWTSALGRTYIVDPEPL